MRIKKLLCCLCWPLLAQAEVRHIGNDELKDLLRQGVALVDLRTAAEWRQTGVIPGSRLLTLFDEQGRSQPEQWRSRLEKFAPADAPVILICRSGNRTRQAAQYLDSSGRKGVVYNVRAGIDGWLREGQAVMGAP